MATTQANASSGKPSFAKIAATGLKPPSAPQSHSNNSTNLRKPSVTSAPRDSPTHVTPSPGQIPARPATQPPKPMQLSVRSSQPEDRRSKNGLQVHVHNVDSAASVGAGMGTARGGLLAPAATDDANTQLSSSSGSGKPASLDGKSVASGTTFALDEKESLRPDDSASVQAVDDEDAFLPPVHRIPEPNIGLEDGARAFRDQLREISTMEPSRHGIATQGYGSTAPAPKGVLYVPPAGPGIGLVSRNAGPQAETAEPSPSSPDIKLLEALESPRDRLMVMKLQTDIVDFISDPKEASLILPQCNAYHRMLAHKAADYYMLGHVMDDSASGVRLFKTTNTCLRPPLIDTTTPSTAASTPPPNAPLMKILRRGVDANPAIVNGSNLPSKSTSESGEAVDDDDKKSKLPMSREEREARYEAVRLRIMGAAKPSESTDEQISKDNSRSSSAAGKKSKKKQRSDSEDAFEARSAYSTVYTPPYTSHGFGPAAFGVSGGPGSSHGAVAGQAGFTDQTGSGGFQPYAAHGSGSTQWPAQGYQGKSMQQPGYDLASEFQRTMALQPMPSPQPPSMPGGYPSSYQQPLYGAQQPWSQQGYHMSSQGTQANSGYYGAYQSGAATSQAPLPYQYGQLPSQAFPGRPPSNLEHPLPGSYKGKHFNPQSQAFVPGQNMAPASPFSPQGLNQPTNGISSPYANPIQRQQYAHSQGAPYASPHHQQAVPTPLTAPAQHLMHPLPQPVFPRQPSPNLPLPPKPGSTPQKPIAHQAMPSHTYNQQGHSSIAKWGTPASLPAKPPPPSAESFDQARFPQAQRQPSYNSTASARMPSFGSMPPMAPGIGVGAGNAAPAQHQ